MKQIDFLFVQMEAWTTTDGATCMENKKSQQQIDVIKKAEKKIPIAPHVVHLDHCKIIVIAYKLNEMTVGAIVEKTAHAQVINTKFKRRSAMTVRSVRN